MLKFPSKVLSIVTGYATCSTLLLIVNKWIIMDWPYPYPLSFLQLMTSWISVFILGKLRIISVDGFDKKKMIQFAPASLLFFLGLICNMQLLQNSANPDTFVVIRSFVPLLVAFVEMYLSTRRSQSIKIYMSLTIVVIGGLGYTYSDGTPVFRSYFWTACYVVLMVVDAILVKRIIDNISLSVWGLVLYNNFSASCLYLIFMVLSGEHKTIFLGWDGLEAITSLAQKVIFFSCICGLGISYFGMSARSLFQATAFSVLGIECKFVYMFANTLILDFVASPLGNIFQLVAIFGGLMYFFHMGTRCLTLHIGGSRRPSKREFEELPLEDPDDVETK